MADVLVIIGPGRMGLALGTAVRDARAVERIVFMGRGIEPPPHPIFEPVNAEHEWEAPPAVEYLMWPSPLPQGATLVLLAVPDRALADVVHDLARQGASPPGAVVLHLSGALSTDVLEPLHMAGYGIGSMHPLQAVADPWLSGDRLHGVAFTLSGEPMAVNAARRLANALGGMTLVVPPAVRPLYHAAAVMASNYLVALIDVAVRVLGQAGVEEQDALAALLPLVQGTVENVKQLGLPAALTGPIPRGDVDTIRLHLARLSPRDRVLYCDLGLELLQVARGVGLDGSRADEIEALLSSG